MTIDEIIALSAILIYSMAKYQLLLRVATAQLQKLKKKPMTLKLPPVLGLGRSLTITPISLLATLIRLNADRMLIAFGWLGFLIAINVVVESGFANGFPFGFAILTTFVLIGGVLRWCSYWLAEEELSS